MTQPVTDHRLLPLALRAQGAGLPALQEDPVRDRPDRPVLRRRALHEALAGAAHPGADRRPRDALRLVGDLPVPRGASPRAGALPARRRRARARALARGVRRHAHGRRLHLEALQPARDQPVRVRREDRRGDPAAGARRGHPERARLPRVASCRRTGFAFGDFSIADIAIAAFFRNAAFARFRVDAARWPKTAAFVDRVLAMEAFAQLAPFEDRMLRTPIAQHRAALAEMGAPILAETYGTATRRSAA